VVRSPGRRRGAAGLAVAALSLTVSALTAPPSLAHSFTKSDGNDSPGRLDIRSASVGHKGSAVVHTVKTQEGWTAAALGDDSFFIVEIDTNFDEDFERCAFIYFADRLRGALTNCRDNFLGTLPVAKPSRTAAKITISDSVLPAAYRWVVFSFWTGAPTRCADLCFDAAPNRPPPILHDITPPSFLFTDEDTIRVWDASTTPDFDFPFSVDDAHTGLASWAVQSRPLGGTVWTEMAAGTGEGDQNPTFTGISPGQYDYRVVATDGQENVGISGIRPVHVPTDVDAATGPGDFDTTGVNTDDGAAWGGSYVALDDLTDSYTITVDHPGGPCRTVTLIGPTLGDWVVEVTDGSVSLGITLRASDHVVHAQRRSLFSESICSDTTRVFTVTGGTDGSAGFGVDAVVI
jgi:hypothetical protein